MTTFWLAFLDFAQNDMLCNDALARCFGHTFAETCHPEEAARLLPSPCRGGAGGGVAHSLIPQRVDRIRAGSPRDLKAHRQEYHEKREQASQQKGPDPRICTRYAKFCSQRSAA